MPSDIVHVVIAVLARLVFEATHRYRKLNGAELPTILVLEEAHNFIQQHAPQTEEATVTPVQMCRSVFEKIAREGRKFGLGLVLSSQRPSELSPTVLAQCNTFLLHRIVNDRDQEAHQETSPRQPRWPLARAAQPTIATSNFARRRGPRASARGDERTAVRAPT